MKLSSEDLAALILVQVAASLLTAAIAYTLFRFHALDWKRPFTHPQNNTNGLT